MHLPDIDLRLLEALLALMRERNIRKASESLGISQAALNRGLAKLRQAFNDPLFVATPRGMEPTPRALSAKQPILQIIALASEQLNPIAQFEPTSSERQFSIASSDVGELMLIPTLIRQCANAPHVRIHAHRLSIKTLADDLQSGEVDVAVGNYPALDVGIRHRRLFTEQYVCLVRDAHPAIRGSMTIEQFLAAKHIVVAARVLGHIHGIVERALLELLPRSSVKVTSSSFLLSALVASETDCVLVAPSTLARLMHARCALQVLDCPVETKAFDIHMYWHERSHHDPAHRWLRSLISENFGDTSERT